MLNVIYVECHYSKCRKEAYYAECRLAECLYAECRGAILFCDKTVAAILVHVSRLTCLS